MALIDSTEEIKRHNSSVTLQLSVESILSFVDDAINKHILPAISAAQFDALISWKAGFTPYNELSAYTTGNKVLYISEATGLIDFYAVSASATAGQTPETHPAKWALDTSKERSVFILVQKACINFAIAYYVSFGSLQLSDSGAHVIQSGENRIASDKKLIQLKRQSLSDGHYALELAQEYLESNLATFTIYAASAAHTRNRNSFINSSAEFNSISAIQIEPILFSSIRNIQKQVQEDQVQAVLGEDLITTLITAIKGGTTTENQQKLILRVQKALIPLTLAEAIPYKLITVDVNGVFQLRDTVGGISGNVETREPADDRMAQLTMNRLVSRGESELESLRKWLYTNAELFSDYTAQGSKGDQDVNTSGSGVYMM